MRTPGIVQRHPELRWLVSVVLIVAVVAAIATSVSGVFRNDSALPATSPGQLVSQVRAPRITGYSGTVVSHIDLGLPASVLTALSDAVPVGGALLHGSHTMRYWYGGEDRQRVAVVGQSAEQDVFRNGTQLLLWDTSTRIAQRSTISKDSGALPLALATPAALTPPQLASRILDLAGDSTDTTLRSGDPVAHRSTYELVVRPESPASRIDSVHIEIDGLESVPLGVQIYARGAVEPAVDVSFTDVNFTEPASQNFSFTPPVGSDVRSTAVLGPLASMLSEVSVIESGWLSIGSYSSGAALNELIDKMLGGSAQKVKGSWGAGRLLQSPLLCVLVTDKGRIVAGPVAPSVLYRSLAK